MVQTMLIMMAVGLFAGIAGAILGLGGGIIITPVLTLMMGLDIKYAIGASIIAVIATSSGSTIAYLRDEVLNLRVAMFLEIATTIGGILGALLTGVLNPKYLYLLFGALLVFSGWNMWRKLRRGQEVMTNVKPDRIATKLKLNGSYFDKSEFKRVDYQVEDVPQGFLVMLGAGLASGMLGIGSGAFKVTAMDTFMKMPLKPSSATSNLMMGVTAAASATVYFFNGSILPNIAVPLALGILVGAVIGSRVMQVLPARVIAMIFIPGILFIGLQMLFGGPQRLVVGAQRGAPVAADETGRVQAGLGIALALQHGQAHEGLHAAHEGAAVIQAVLVVQRDGFQGLADVLGQRCVHCLVSGLAWPRGPGWAGGPDQGQRPHDAPESVGVGVGQVLSDIGRKNPSSRKILSYNRFSWKALISSTSPS